jgi:integrase
MGALKIRESRQDNLELKSSDIIEFVKFNTGIKRFNVNTKKYYVKSEMTKSQLEVNIAVIIQFFTGLRINEIVKMSDLQLKKLSRKQAIKIKISKIKRNVERVIDIAPSNDKQAQRLHKILIKLIKEWLKLEQDYLVISKNMNKVKTVIKKKNGKEYETGFYRYINNFTIKVNKALKKFLEYKEEQGERVLPHHIDKLTTHGFRNNFIVAVYRATNNDLVMTKRIIHHSDIKMTERYIEKYLASIPITPM